MIGCRFVALLILLFLVTVPFSSQAEVVMGKVTSIRGNVMELDLGNEKGIQPGDSGKVWYNVLVQEKEQRIFIATFKITRVSEKSSVAQIEKKTAEVKVGHLAEVSFKTGELELGSDPAGGQIYVDGKEKGETPSVLSDVRLGSHVIRIMKHGYEPYEEQVKLTEGARKKIFASLRTVFPEKTCPAPIWNVGDRWTFKQALGPFSLEVVESEKDVFLIKVLPDQSLRAYDRNTINYLYTIGKDGRKTGNEETALRKLFNFPIFVGKEWTDKIVVSKTGITYTMNSKVEGIEDIVTEAGKFRTYKIFFKETSMASSNSGWTRYWYSPEAKIWVKREVEKTEFWASQPWFRDIELVSYKLK